MLNIRIKASHIGNLTDARYFAAMGVQWMGFSLAPGSSNYISPQAVAGIKAWVEGPKIVGAFQIQSVEEILESANAIELDSIQIGPFFPVEQLNALSDFEIIQEIIIESTTNPKEMIAFAEGRSDLTDFFLLDFEKNGVSWEQIKTGASTVGLTDILFLQQLKPVLIAVSISTEDLPAMLQALPGIGLSVKGGAEEKVGFKSYDELDDLFEKIEALEA